jgi:hypothetical protein
MPLLEMILEQIITPKFQRKNVTFSRKMQKMHKFKSRFEKSW